MDALHSAFQQSSLFQGLTPAQIKRFIAAGELMVFPAHGIIIKEGDVSRDFFLIISGTVEILKHQVPGHTHQVATLSLGDTIGELGIIDHEARSATIRVLEETTVLRIDIKAFEDITKDTQISLLTYHNLATNLSHRLKHTNEITVGALENSLQQAKDKIYMGNAMVSFFIMSGLYTILSDIFSRSPQYFLYCFLALALIFLTTLMIKSGYSMEFYGITTRNWKNATLESLVCSVLMILIITLIKYFSIQLAPQLSQEPLIRIQQEVPQWQEEGSFFWLFLYIIVSIPIQELIFRGCLQGTIQHFLISPYKGLIANFTTSLIFCMTHFFISPTFAFFTMVVSLIWGAMYIHQKTLIGVTLSHILVGIWGLHVLGIEHLFGR